MSDPLPFDLSTLGEIDSPEVVRGALRRFRRRVLRTALVVLVVGALAGGIVIAVDRDPLDYGRRVDAAQGVELGAVFQSGSVTLILAKVADLGLDSGLHFVAVVPNVPDDYEVYGRIEAEPISAGSIVEGEGPLYDMWVVGPLPDSGRFDVIVGRRKPCKNLKPVGDGLLVCTQFGVQPEEVETRFSIDLAALGVPAHLWKKGGTS
jgi:hypothetical protein